MNTWSKHNINSDLSTKVAPTVTFKWNVLLDLSGQAVTKTLSLLMVELLLQVLCQSTGTMTIRVIRDDGGVGDIPGVQGGSGGSVGSAQQRLDWHKNSDLGSDVTDAQFLVHIGTNS